jgi:hypothetical protein
LNFKLGKLKFEVRLCWHTCLRDMPLLLHF